MIDLAPWRRKAGDRWQGEDGIAEYFGQCQDSGLVEPEMQKILATDSAKFFPARDNSRQSSEYKGFKELFDW